MRGIFLDAGVELAEVFKAVSRPGDPAVTVNPVEHVAPEDLRTLLAGYDFVLNDHTFMPTAQMAKCTGLKHVIFLGTGAANFMNPDELAALGITVHIIKGYGDTAFAEHVIALMWAAARDIALMDRGVRAGGWPRREGMQLTGKTLGLIGFGGIAAEVARIAGGSGMKVIAWNRSPKTHPGVEFVELDTLLAQSQVVSLHLLLNDETKGFLSAARIAQLRRGVLLVNTARAAVLDEDAMIAALASGQIGHAALDVFEEEPLPPGHRLAGLDNLTLSAHSAFWTAEATDNLLRMALDVTCRIATE